MIERIFKLTENGTSVRVEVLAGVTTFLTMAYIIVVQPAVLSGKMFGMDTGLDFGDNGNLHLSGAGNGYHGALRALPDRAGARHG